MTLRPVILQPASPSELLSRVITQYRYPTTILIGSTKQEFLDALIQDIQPQDSHPPDQDEQGEPEQPQPEDQTHHEERRSPLLRAPLMQLAVSRHIRIVFIPTVTHLRSYLSSFSPLDSKQTAPPKLDVINTEALQQETPLLLVYGFLNLHRDGSEWSAQGIGNSAAVLIEAAAFAGFRAALVDITPSEERQTLDSLLAENIPLLGGMSLRNDGTWSGRVVSIQRVLSRWFEREPRVA